MRSYRQRQTNCPCTWWFDRLGKLGTICKKLFQHPNGYSRSVARCHIIDGLSITIPNSSVAEFPGGHASHIVSRDKFISELEKFQRRGCEMKFSSTPT